MAPLAPLGPTSLPFPSMLLVSILASGATWPFVTVVLLPSARLVLL